MGLLYLRGRRIVQAAFEQHVCKGAHLPRRGARRWALCLVGSRALSAVWKCWRCDVCDRVRWAPSMSSGRQGVKQRWSGAVNDSGRRGLQQARDALGRLWRG